MRTLTTAVVGIAALALSGLLGHGPLAPARHGEPVPTPPPAIASGSTPAERPAATPNPTLRYAVPPPEPTSTPMPPPAPTPTGELEVHFIDVGQGDATLLLAPDATMLIDTGRHDRTDVVDYLHATGVETIDVLAVTHGHSDHLGQFAQILKTFTVTEVWWSGAPHTTTTFDAALAALIASDAAYDEPRAGDTTTVGSLLVEFVNPSPHADFDDLHVSGLALRVTYGEVAFLFTGDAEAATEARMLAAHPDLLAADVYQVGHHGSATSTTPAFLAAVSPTIAVYSAGAGNPYGHPDETVILRLVDAGVAVYGTVVHGTVIITTDGTDLTVTG